MIPLQLTLKNFLSYREATLNFRGLHTACICGANGAGKSSLLEAITWVIWGQSRTASDDDLIHAGTENVRVDFQFISNQQHYRIIRSRHRSKTSSLDFQIESGGEFRSLSGKRLKDTQQQINTYLKLDYDTFINSAYLRQGKADEFMQRRPSERKQILADLLKLDQYEELANQAKDLSKQFKGQAEQLSQSLQTFEQQLADKSTLTHQRENLETEIQQLQLAQDHDRNRLQQLQVGEQQRQTWQQHLTWQQNQYLSVTQECDRFFQEQLSLKNQLTQLESLLKTAPEITSAYQRLLQLQQQEEIFSAKFQTYQEAQQQKQQLEQQLLKQTNDFNLQIQQTTTRLETLQQQEQEIQQVLSQSSDVQSALEQLRHHRQRLNTLDQLQHKVTPLLQRRHTLQTEIERTQAQLSAKLEQLQNLKSQLETQLAQVPQLRQEALKVDADIRELDKKEVYKQRVEEKGQEKNTFQQTLQKEQTMREEQVKELSEKLEKLTIPEAICPLCEQELDEYHREQVVQKTQQQQQTLQEQIWRIQEKITVYERDLKQLRNEYSQLKKELENRSFLQQQFGQLEAQLEASGEVKSKLKKIRSEIEELEALLTNGNYAQDLQLELQVINQEIAKLNYDEQTHALVRGEEKRWRWAEIKQGQIEQASRRQAIIDADKPKLLEQINQLRNALRHLQQSSNIKREIQLLELCIEELGYERSQHQNILNFLRQAQDSKLHYQKLKQAEQQHPELQIKYQELEQTIKGRLNDKETLRRELEDLVLQIEATEDNQAEMQNLSVIIQQRRQQLDELLSQRGRLEQSLIQLENLQTQAQETKEKIKDVRKKYRIYQELSQAFGKNGIQALMIENILPQLEAETNQILARLTGNQLHVQFLTQKASKSGSTKKQGVKLIDTLEIFIADSRGTRPYETYSGGEAFRINFSIRLALARLLAQRAGTSLQMLIVDEGFGTQDTEGCDRLIAAINAIATDFSCILTVTHMPQFKEAFQYRIEVRKTLQGSQLVLSS